MTPALQRRNRKRRERTRRRDRSALARSRAAAAGIRIELGEAQYLVYQTKARFRVLVAGRRFGKTVLACMELVLFALLHGNANCWYVAPTKEMAEEIAWDVLEALVKLLPANVVSSMSRNKLRIRFRNGSVVQLKSAHKRDTLRGRPLDFLVLDECAMLEVELWDEVLSPMLADKEGRALLISTPRGFNFFYDLYNDAVSGKANDDAFIASHVSADDEDPLKPAALQGLSPEALAALRADAPDEWAAWQFTTMDGGRVKPAEIARLRARLDPRAFRQELYASFEAMGGRVYEAFTRSTHFKHDMVDRGFALYVGIDFNVNPMTAVIGQAGDTVDQLEILAALSIETSNTRELGEAVIARFGGRDPVTGLPRRQLIAHPDPAGANRDTRSGTTDHQILRDLGFHVDAASAHPPVVDRVNAVQALLGAADGTIRIRLHPTDCIPLVRSLEGQVWDEKKRAPDKDGGLDHPVDALGYLVHRSFNVLAQLWKPVSVSW